MGKSSMDHKIDEYGLRFLSFHCVRSGKQQELFSIIERPTWHSLKIANDPSRRSLAGDIALGIQELPENDVVNLVSYSLLYSFIGSIAASLSIEGIALMVAVGEGENAERIASLYTDPVERIEAMSRIVEQYSNLGNNQKAKQVSRIAFDIVSDMPKVEFRDRSIVPVAASLARSGDTKSAIVLAGQIQNQILMQQALGQIALFGFQKGERKNGVKVLESIDHIPTRIFAAVVFLVLQKRMI